jgi:hypothetical protein
MVVRTPFVIMLAGAVLVAACGREVTPTPPTIGAGGTSPGFMSITFQVAGQLNYSSYGYWVVFNTAGSGYTPGTFPWNNNYAGYSFAIQVGGTSGSGTYANAWQYIRSSNPHVLPTATQLPINAALLQYNPDSNGGGNQFTVIFSRSLFKGLASTAPSPAPVWLFNAFTTQAPTANPFAQGTILDSLGVGGAIGPQFNSPPLNVAESFDNPYSGYATTSDPAAQIATVTIANNP